MNFNKKKFKKKLNFKNFKNFKNKKKIILIKFFFDN